MTELSRLPHVRRLIRLALEEDIGHGDITTDALVAPDDAGVGEVAAKEPLVLAGCDLAAGVFRELDPRVAFEALRADGDRLEAGDVLCRLAGPTRSLLTGERTALNFLQRLSGIATHVRRHVDALGPRPVRLVDTRKTTPGWRVLEKYAVRVGGAWNHRMGLDDGILVKDNHIAAAGGIPEAVRRAREAAGHMSRIEVEVADPRELAQALEAGVDIVMLDNMDLAAVREAVAAVDGRALVEISGGVTLDRLPALADAGADIISCGALTHSATAVDISMSIGPAPRAPARRPRKG